MKIRTIIALLLCFPIFSLFSEDMPVLYYKFGTERNQIIFELGEPEYFLPGGHLQYTFYSGASSYEKIIFLIDENNKLFATTIDIGLDYSTPIPIEELQNRVFKYYKDYFEGIFGVPYISNEMGLLWKFDDAFCFFQPYVKDTFLRFKYISMPKEYAEEVGYGEIYQ